MKCFILLVALFTLAVANARPNESKPSLTLDQEWENFKSKFQKTYKDDKEEEYRKGIFASSLKRIQEHNKKYDAGEVTFKQGINKLADLTSDEYRTQYLGARS